MIRVPERVPWIIIAILKVTKYRALEAYSGEVSYEPGATLFAMGEEKDGMIMVRGMDSTVQAKWNADLLQSHLRLG